MTCWQYLSFSKMLISQSCKVQWDSSQIHMSCITAWAMCSAAFTDPNAQQKMMHWSDSDFALSPGLLWQGLDRAAAPATYRAFPGTPPASGSGSPGRTWPLRMPAAPEAATWAASWLWAAPSNHPVRDLVSPCSEEETLKTHTRTHTHTATYWQHLIQTRSHRTVYHI